MKVVLNIFFLLFTLVAFSQVPQVPDRMDFAGMKLKFTESAKRSIQKDVDQLRKSPRYFEEKAERARIYFPIIERVFEEENVPDEFKFLVLQESGLISDAVSSANAVGFWQLKDFTAMELGIRVDRNIDERKNIVASSYAAARYFKKANQTFDNWLYSLQSYQMGIGGATRALDESNYGKRNLTIDNDTYWYVKKFLAYLIAYRDVVENPPTTPITEFIYGNGKTLSEISKETGFAEENLKEYNKWLLKSKVPDDKPYTVILPGFYESSKIELAKNSVEIKAIKNPNLSSQALIFPKIHHNKFKDHKYIIGVNGLPGIIASATDNAQTLAMKGEISRRKFNLYNDLSANQSISAGQVYYFKKKKSKAGTHYHTLQENENLWSISQKYGIRLDKLVAKNRIASNEKLQTGRVLWLRYIRPDEVPIEYSHIEKKSPGVDEDASHIIEASLENKKENKSIKSPPPEVTTKEEIVVKQETKPVLDTYPKENENVSIDESEDDAEVIYPYVGKTKKIHTVKKGETYYSISKLYDIPVPALIQWNKLSVNDKIYIGQYLVYYLDDNSAFIIHKVLPGETLYKIARQYNVSVDNLLLWNNKLDYHLKIGESIKVSK